MKRACRSTGLGLGRLSWKVLLEGLHYYAKGRRFIEMDTEGAALREVKLEELRKKVREGFDEIDRGEYLEFSSAEEMTAHICREGRKHLADRKRNQGG